MSNRAGARGADGPPDRRESTSPGEHATVARATVALHGGRIDERLALLEGTESALVLGSGMAAISCTMLSLLRADDHLVASTWLHDETRRFIEQELPNLGIQVSFVDPSETRGWRRVTRGNTRMFFVSSPVQPTTRVVDLTPVRLLAQELGIALVVDATAASPVNFRPVEHGADVVVHSGTAFLHGEHGMQAGVVCGAEGLIDEVRDKMCVWGHAPDPFVVELLERSLKTLEIRVLRQNQNAMRIAHWAAAHTGFRAVYYPGLASHPDHAVCSELLTGFGSQLVLVPAAGAPSATDVLSRTRLFRHASTLGGVESIMHQLNSATDAAPDPYPELPGVAGALRLSLGIEEADDLIADLAQAME